MNPILTLICEKRHNTKNTIAKPIPIFILYIPANAMNATRIKLPKMVSKRDTNKLGTAYITTHKVINNVIKPTTILRFLREKIEPSDAINKY